MIRLALEAIVRLLKLVNVIARQRKISSTIQDKNKSVAYEKLLRAMVARRRASHDFRSSDSMPNDKYRRD
ncbi:MAG: hypothetical protein AAGA76_04170 [Pseudomonadota bacterium]